LVHIPTLVCPAGPFFAQQINARGALSFLGKIPRPNRRIGFPLAGKLLRVAANSLAAGTLDLAPEIRVPPRHVKEVSYENVWL
jgi:hypothetical protein